MPGDDDSLDPKDMAGGEPTPTMSGAMNENLGLPGNLSAGVPSAPAMTPSQAITQKHGGLLTGLASVLIDGLTAGLTTPQSGQGMEQSAAKAMQLPQQRQQQQMNIQSQQLMLKAQLAQSHIQDLQSRLMLSSLNDELESGMTDMAWKFFNKALDNGQAKMVSGEGTREAAASRLKELHDQNPDKANNLFLAPGMTKGSFGVWEVYPKNASKEDQEYTIPGDEDSGIPDQNLKFPAGTDMGTMKTMISSATRDQIAKIHAASTAQQTQAKATEGAANRTSREKIAADRNAAQGQRAATAQANKDAKQQQKDDRDTVYGMNPQTSELEMTSRSDAEQRGLQGIYSVKAGDIQKDKQATRQLNDVQLNTSRFNTAIQAAQQKGISGTDYVNMHSILNKAGALDLNVAIGEGGNIKLPVISSLIEGLNREVNSEAYAKLSPEAKGLLDGYIRTLASVPAYQKALTGIGRSNKEMLDLELANIPNPTMKPADMARKMQQFQENIDRATEGFPKFPGMQSPKEVKQQLSGKFASREDATQTRSQGRPVVLNGKVIGYTKDGKTMTPVQ